jgi:hypothetical protein
LVAGDDDLTTAAGGSSHGFIGKLSLCCRQLFL